MAEYKVYQATHVPTGKVYIGLTKSALLKRIGQHLSLTAYKRNNFQNFLHTTKYEDWTWDVLFTVADAEYAYQLEMDTIKDRVARKFEVLNLVGAAAVRGDPSAWLRDHQYQPGTAPWNKGKSGHLSHETVTKMRMAKLRNPVVNRPTPEAIKATKLRQGTPIVCVETGAEFLSIGEAASTMGIERSCIRRVLNGLSGHASGYSFRYLNSLQKVD